MSIKNLVFDMGNVLISFDTVNILRKKGVTDEADIKLFCEKIFMSEEWQAYDRGVVDKSAFVPLIKKLPEKLSVLADEMILKNIFVVDNSPPIKAMEELIKKAKNNGYKIYLLSNAGQDFYIYSKGIPALKYFDGLFVSSDYKLLKPEKEIYEAFLEKFDLIASECLFVDDLQINIDGAAKCGIDGICFNASKEDISVLYRKYADKGVLI